MKAEFLNTVLNLSDNLIGGLAAVLWLAYLIAYWRALWSLLLREGFETNDRILWFLVITMVPVIGLITYWFLVPGRELVQSKRIESEP